MKNRFAKKKTDLTIIKNTVLPVGLFVLCAALFGWGISTLGATTQEERVDSLRKAIMRAAVQCYALEGQYPPNLAYLSEHYGLALDTENYIIDYQIFASNIMPVVLVLPRELDTRREIDDEPAVLADRPPEADAREERVE